MDMDIPTGIVEAYKPMSPQLALYIVAMDEGSEYKYMLWGVNSQGEHSEFEDAETFDTALRKLNRLADDLRDAGGTTESDLVIPVEKLTPGGLETLVATGSKETHDNPHGWLTGMEVLNQWAMGMGEHGPDNA